MQITVSQRLLSEGLCPVKCFRLNGLVLQLEHSVFITAGRIKIECIFPWQRGLSNSATITTSTNT